MSLYDDASLIMYPSGVKSGKIYCQKPTDGTGDLTFTRASTATRVNASGLIEDVASGVPRIDYTGGGCGKLLLEPQRTNIIVYSESLNSHSKSRSIVTDNATNSPDGTQNASKIIPLSTSTGWSGINASPNYAFTSGYTYTLSVFCKAGEYNYVQVGGSTPAFPGSFATINLINGIVEHQSGITATTESYGNGWWKISFTHTAITTAISAIGFIAVYSTAVSSRLVTQVGDDVSGIYAWGWQAEQGSYATSYIPTSGAAVTRVVDSSITTAFSSIIGQTEGVLFLDITLTRESYDSTRVMQIDTGSDSNRIQIAINGSNISLAIVDGGVVQASFNSTIVSGINKLALAYKNNDAVGYHNATQLGTDTSCTIPSCSNLILGYRPGSASLGDFVNASLLYKQRLSNSQLETLTTL